MLKAKGWPVAGVDLGDLYPEKTSFREQGLLRYQTAMHSMREMGYIAIGVGKTEFGAEIFKVIGEYALRNRQPPYILAGNLMGMVDGKPVPREEYFKPPEANRPMIDLVEVASVGQVTVGVAGIVGKSLAEDVEKAKLDPSVTFEKVKEKVDNAGVLKNAVAALQRQEVPTQHPDLPGHCGGSARRWPRHGQQFRVILCQADDPEPPQFPVLENNGQTLIVQVGHKGRYVGVVGVFRKSDGFDLHYQARPARGVLRHTRQGRGRGEEGQSDPVSARYLCDDGARFKDRRWQLFPGGSAAQAASGTERDAEGQLDLRRLGGLQGVSRGGIQTME